MQEEIKWDLFDSTVEVYDDKQHQVVIRINFFEIFAKYVQQHKTQVNLTVIGRD